MAREFAGDRLGRAVGDPLQRELHAVPAVQRGRHQAERAGKLLGEQVVVARRLALLHDHGNDDGGDGKQDAHEPVPGDAAGEYQGNCQEDQQQRVGVLGGEGGQATVPGGGKGAFAVCWLAS